MELPNYIPRLSDFIGYQGLEEYASRTNDEKINSLVLGIMGAPVMLTGGVWFVLENSGRIKALQERIRKKLVGKKEGVEELVK